MVLITKYGHFLVLLLLARISVTTACFEIFALAVLLEKANRSYHASTKSLPVHCGEELYINVVTLSVPIKGGSTRIFACVDKFSGRLDIVSGPSKCQNGVFTVIYDKLVVSCYLKYGNITKAFTMTLKLPL